ncbi:SCO4848 family membrane protein [Actinoplanes sp. NPDC051343]|jgi:hypothetical protein|uniref:SCO4848 family membrane protein n=1 Tax=Actinoplanes sp. NPDC051343 TaxID=3363906 RepID=UPI0037A4ADA6
MVISRKWAVFLIGVGVWTWLIWPRFGLAIYDDDRAFRNGTPTAFLWVHAVLIVASLVIGTTVGVLGIRAWRAGRSGIGRVAEAEEIVASGAGRPQD